MARSISEIYTQIIKEKNRQSIIKDVLLPDSNTADNLNSLLNELTSGSRVAIWRLLAFVYAACVFFLEKMVDLRNAEVEAMIAIAGTGSAAWLRAKIFEFQFSSTDPQIVKVNTMGQVSYPTVDESLQIIKRCAIIQRGNNVVDVKLAKVVNDVPAALTTTELEAAQGYINNIAFAGTLIRAFSNPPDFLFITGELRHDGQFSPTIVNDVKQALNDYLQRNSDEENFGAQVKVLDILVAISQVPGVLDFRPTRIAGRAFNVSPFSRTIFYDIDLAINTRQYLPFAGYMILESTFSNDITFTAVV